MITIFNRKEIYLTYSMSEQAKIRDKLSQANIKYYVKTVNRMSPSPFAGVRRSRTGSFGQNMDLNYEYTIYVHKKDYEQAKYVINQWTRGTWINIFKEGA